MSRECKSNGSCSFCNGRHHSSVCKRHETSGQFVGDSPRSNVQPRTNNSSTVQPPVTSGHTSTSTTGLCCVNGDTPVLLQTAQAYIDKPSDSACGMVVRLLDGGSQRSYITERVKEALEH